MVYVENGEFRPEMAAKDRIFVKRRADRFAVVHGKLCHKNAVGEPQRVVRQEIRDRIDVSRIDTLRVLSGVHDDAGLYGARMALTQLMRNYSWPAMAKDIIEEVKACEALQGCGPNVSSAKAES